MESTNGENGRYGSLRCEYRALGDEVAIFDGVTADDLRQMSLGSQTTQGWCTAFIIQRGEVQCTIGGKAMRIGRLNMFVTLWDNGAFLREVSDDVLCRVMLFSNAFLAKLRLSDTMEAYFSVKQNPLIELNTMGAVAIGNFFDMALALLKQEDNPFRLESLVSLTEAFFYGAGYYFHLQQRRRDKDMPAIIAEQFMRLLQQHGLQQHSLSFYADRLCISTKYLSACVGQATGKTALKQLQDHIVQEADALLREAASPLSDIARQLGFGSTEDFSKYYKRVTGRSPSATRRHK